MILELLIILLWLAGGGYTAKLAIASAEKHYLALAEKNGRPQNKMDGEDWVGALIFALAAFTVFPAVLAFKILSYPAKMAFKPVREVMVPPVQKEFEVRVEKMEHQKHLVLESAKTYAEVLDWEPDDETKGEMLLQIRKNAMEQLKELQNLAIVDSDVTGHGANFMDSLRSHPQMKALGR